MIEGTISNLKQSLGIGQANSLFKFTTLGQFITSLVSLIMSLAALIAFLFLLWGGMMWITASGNKENLQAAKDRIMNAITGFAITACAYVIWQLLLRFFGLSTSFPQS